MKISKTAVEDFRIWLGVTKLNCPIKNDGTARKNISYKNRIKIGDSFLEFLYCLVDVYVRTIDRNTEKIDVTKIWIPHNILEELNDLLSSVQPMWIFYTPEDTQRYKGELDDKNVVVFDNDVIIPKWNRRESCSEK